MNRRHFLRKLFSALKSMAIAGVLSNKVLAATSSMMDTFDKQHFKPINGRSLRDIARQKAHHGSNGFLNPLGPAREGRLWQVLRWKLFHENRFKDDFAGERVIPVSIDWDSVKQHRGSSITFIKHASVLIKDGNRTLMVDPVFSSIFWFIKDFAPLKFNLNSMPTPDHVLITHGHYDHLDESSLSFFDKNMHVITPLGYNENFKDLDGTWQQRIADDGHGRSPRGHVRGRCRLPGRRSKHVAAGYCGHARNRRIHRSPMERERQRRRNIRGRDPGSRANPGDLRLGRLYAGSYNTGDRLWRLRRNR